GLALTGQREEVRQGTGLRQLGANRRAVDPRRPGCEDDQPAEPADRKPAETGRNAHGAVSGSRTLTDGSVVVPRRCAVVVRRVRAVADGKVQYEVRHGPSRSAVVRTCP